MPSLKMPKQCDRCGSMQFKKAYGPERWECLNGHVVISRGLKSQPGICRTCGKKKGEVPFANHGNICRKCKYEQHKQWKARNLDKAKAAHRASYQRDKEKRKLAIKTSVERSMEAFLRYQMLEVRKRNKFRLAHKSKHKGFEVTIDYPYLLGLLKEQSGLCAISHIPMDHHWGNFNSMSIDRIDSAEGYVPGNVQLICQALNLAKRERSNESFREFLKQIAIGFIRPILKDRFPEAVQYLQEYKAPLYYPEDP